MKFSNNNESEKIEMKPENVSGWDVNCYLFARVCWEMGCRDINECDVTGFRWEVVKAVGLHGLHKINEILEEYFDIWEQNSI